MVQQFRSIDSHSTIIWGLAPIIRPSSTASSFLHVSGIHESQSACRNQTKSLDVTPFRPFIVRIATMPSMVARRPLTINRNQSSPIPVVKPREVRGSRMTSKSEIVSSNPLFPRYPHKGWLNPSLCMRFMRTHPVFLQHWLYTGMGRTRERR